MIKCNDRKIFLIAVQFSGIIRLQCTHEVLSSDSNSSSIDVYLIDEMINRRLLYHFWRVSPTNICYSHRATFNFCQVHNEFIMRYTECVDLLQSILTTTRQIWGIWKLRPAYSPETPNLSQNQWCFVSCDLKIWWMTLENNRASLLCCFKLCATFHSHWWIQTGVTVRKRPIWVKFDDF